MFTSFVFKVAWASLIAMILTLSGCVQQPPRPEYITTYADREIGSEAVYGVCVQSVVGVYLRYGHVDEYTLPFIRDYCEETRRRIMKETHLKGKSNRL